VNAATLKNIIHLKPIFEDKWEVDVLKTIGNKGTGIEELLEEIRKHKIHLKESGFLDRKRKYNLTKKIYELVNNKLHIQFWNEKNKKVLNDNLSSIYERKDDPYSFVDSILDSKKSIL